MMSASTSASASLPAPDAALVEQCNRFSQAPAADANEDEQTDALNRIILMLHGRRITIKDVVVASGEGLISEDESKRKRSVLLLSELLVRMPTMQLDATARHSLITFLTERLKDEACWRECLMGLHGLIRHHSPLSSGDPTLILRAILERVDVPRMTQSGRKFALDIIECMTQQATQEVIDLKEDFVAGVLRCIDGEKDPRNLLVSFRLATFLLEGTTVNTSATNVDSTSTSASSASSSTRVSLRFPSLLLAPFMEELFEITSCYFPITFHPPPNDPIGITGNELQQGLRCVFGSHPMLAEYVIPLLLEKMDGTSEEVKMDSIDSLRYCVEHGEYTVVQWDPFLGQIQTALKKELLHGSGHTGVVASASTCFAAFVRLLCPDEVGGFPAFHLAPSWDLWMSPLLMEVASELTTMPDSKLARAYATLLQLVCASTGNALMRSMDKLFNEVIEKKFYSPHAQPTQRLALLELVDMIIQSTNQQYKAPFPQHPLRSYSDSMLSMLNAVLVGGSVEQRCVALRAMANMAALPPVPLAASATTDQSMEIDHPPSAAATNGNNSGRLLSFDNARSIIVTLASSLLTDIDASVRMECEAGLVRIGRVGGGRHFRPLLLECVIPSLFNPKTKMLLPSSAKSDAAESTSATQAKQGDLAATSSTHAPTLEDILSATSSLCRAAFLIDAILPQLLQLVSTHFIRALQGSTPHLQAIHGLLECLMEIVMEDGDNENKDKEKKDTESQQRRTERLACCVSTLPQALIGMLVNGSLLITQVNPTFALDARVVSSAVVILQTVVRAADASSAQQTLVDQVLRLFLDGDVSPYAQASLPLPANVAFTPMTVTTGSSASKSQLQLIPLLTAVVGSLRRDVSMPRLPDLVSRLQAFISSQSSDPSTPFHVTEAPLSAIECLASIINKLPNDQPMLQDFIKTQMEGEMLAQIQDASLELDQRLRVLCCLLWCTKALLMRSHPRSSQFASKLVQLLAVQQSNDNAMAENVARGFGLLLQDTFTVLNRDAHAICGPGQLYKQRFFVQNLPHMLALFQTTMKQDDDDAAASNATDQPTTSSSTRYVVLLALSHLLKHVPHTIIKQELQTLLPLLLQSLSHPNPELRVATLDTVTVLLRDDLKTLAPHLSTLIPVLLDLMLYKPSKHVRLNALACLGQIRLLPYQQLHPFRERVLATLGSALDDHKKAVRKAAAKARNQWYLLSE